MEMIKKLREKKGGFTLVELIVVLVILALLAAILVPTLLGYINKANSEKDYATAQTVRVAAQSVIEEGIAKKDTAITGATALVGDSGTNAATLKAVDDLAGVKESDVTAFNFGYDKTTGQLTGTETVTINTHTYEYSVDDNTWSAASAQ